MAIPSFLDYKVSQQYAPNPRKDQKKLPFYYSSYIRWLVITKAKKTATVSDLLEQLNMTNRFMIDRLVGITSSPTRDMRRNLVRAFDRGCILGTVSTVVLCVLKFLTPIDVSSMVFACTVWGALFAPILYTSAKTFVYNMLNKYTSPPNECLEPTSRNLEELSLLETKTRAAVTVKSGTDAAPSQSPDEEVDLVELEKCLSFAPASRLKL